MATTKTVRLPPSGLTKRTQVQQWKQTHPNATVKSSRVKDGQVVMKVKISDNDAIMGTLDMDPNIDIL